MNEAPEDWVIRRAFALTLRNLRHKVGIAQETLALEADVNRGYMSGLERGLHSPTISMIYRLLPHLQATFVDFAIEFERCLRHARRQSGPRGK